MILAHVLSLMEPQRVVDFFLLGPFPGTTALAARPAPLGAWLSARAASQDAHRPAITTRASRGIARTLPPCTESATPSSSLTIQPASSTPGNVEGPVEWWRNGQHA